MHIPDGFLNAGTLAGTAVVSAGGIANAVRVVGKKFGEKQVPLMGILAAFVFAAQMLNFPIMGGTSGHFMGAALCAVLLGPWAAVIVFTLVLMAQCFIFQDGGMLALGANIFNMGIVGGLGSYAIYRLGLKVFGVSLRSKMAMGYIAAWFSVVLAATACALELAISGVSPLGGVLTAMVGVHAIIGLVEGAITVAALVLIRSTRADLLELQETEVCI
ncbi:MAG: energy-coupling factor ABC transporter permease [Dehalococcoidia bacterium]|nr:energy-coupling factor ABC transporter permease [Dehalococcoidia bacterium]